MPHLLDDTLLERSSVVANASMNRDRGLAGVNSYAKDLAFNPLGFLKERLQRQQQVGWLDLCCGSGKALIQAARHLDQEGLGSFVTLVGVDLVPLFDPCPPELGFLDLHAASLSTWQPGGNFDLITCVHGLHYIGDKLGLFQRTVSWLGPEGLFLGHLDLSNVRTGGKEDRRGILRALRQAGLSYHPGRHVLSCQGRKVIALPFKYLGADDAAGPNFTKQPVVDSYYEPWIAL